MPRQPEINYTKSIWEENQASIDDLKNKLAEKELLLSLNNDIAMVRDRKDILRVIHPKLNKLFNTDDIFICLIDKKNQTLNPFLRVAGAGRSGSEEYESVINARFPIGDLFLDNIVKSGKPVITDLHEFNRSAIQLPYIKTSEKHGLAESLSVTLKNSGETVGVFTLWAEQKNSFTNYHVELIESIADQISIVVSNILANEELLQREEEKDVLLTISREFTAVREREELLPLLKNQFDRLSFYSDVVIAKVDEDGDTFSAFVLNEADKRVEDPDYPQMKAAHHRFPDGVFEVALNAEKPVCFDIGTLAKKPDPLPYIKFIYDNGVNDMIGISLRDRSKAIGVLFLFSPGKNSFSELQLNLAQAIGNQLGTVVSNILANEKLKEQLDQISIYKRQLEEENTYLLQQVQRVESYKEIIGASEKMQNVFRSISQVAFAESTVLILGETGTGKELVARAIHNSSPRHNRLLMKVNCAVIPANLIESELFGHEKGSFTGATDKRIGKFELADNSTLFLDEIGELLPELQSKLLRVIQEKEIERIGGTSTIKVNVRIIAATNRNLQKEVDKGNFRQDLFYRLNVFPITLPPLRERKDDIPLLTAYFIEKFSNITGKRISGISSKAMKKLLEHDWPGNIRELEHLIERTVLISNSEKIKDVQIAGALKNIQADENGEEVFKTHEENEREYIIRVLNKCKGKIYGPGGAASILNLRVSTLNSKIRKLGIKKSKLFK